MVVADVMVRLVRQRDARFGAAFGVKVVDVVQLVQDHGKSRTAPLFWPANLKIDAFWRRVDIGLDHDFAAIGSLVTNP